MARWTRRRVVMLDEELDNRLQKAADKDGLSAGTFIRALIMRELGVKPPEEVKPPGT